MVLTRIDSHFHSEDLWNELQTQMIIRTRDKVPVIRCQAVAALGRLQNPSDKGDPVIKEYLRLLVSDSSKYCKHVNNSDEFISEVRKAVLSNIGMSKHTLQLVLDRTRDVKPDVRRQAFLVLCKKVNIKVLSISKRMELLRQGLKDRYLVEFCFSTRRDPRVVDACIDMVSKGWLPSLQDDIEQVLSHYCVGLMAHSCSSSWTLKTKKPWNSCFVPYPRKESISINMRLLIWIISLQKSPSIGDFAASSCLSTRWGKLGPWVTPPEYRRARRCNSRDFQIVCSHPHS